MDAVSENTEQARLLRTVVDLHQGVRAQMCRLMGMHDTDYAALTLLLSGPLGPSELAASLGMSTAAVTTVVDRLEAAGHVRRLPHLQDRRRTAVHVTPATQELARDEIGHLTSAAVHILDDFDARERAAVLRYLERTRAVLEQSRDDLVARVGPHDGQERV